MLISHCSKNTLTNDLSVLWEHIWRAHAQPSLLRLFCSAMNGFIWLEKEQKGCDSSPEFQVTCREKKDATPGFH